MDSGSGTPRALWGMDIPRRVNRRLTEAHLDLLVPRPDHVEIALTLLREVGTAGNLTTDAQLAAIAIDRGAEIRSHDIDFGRFAGVSWADPLA